MVPPAQRGKLIGVMMSGLLCGVLLARTVAGFVSDHLGWRALYAGAAVSMLILGFCLRRSLPHQPAALRLPYGQLMRSMLELLRAQPVLRRASLVSALSFASFTAFWATLSFLLMEHFHEGSSEAGLFGVAGLIGAAGAPLAGKFSDRRSPGFTVSLALLLTTTAFVIMGRWVTIPGLILGVLLMDLGVQSVQVAAQASVISALAGSAFAAQHALHGGALRGRGGGLVHLWRTGGSPRA